MDNNLNAYYEEIRSSCPSMTEDEVIEAGDSLLRVFSLLCERIEESPELQKELEKLMEDIKDEA